MRAARMALKRSAFTLGHERARERKLREVQARQHVREIHKTRAQREATLGHEIRRVWKENRSSSPGGLARGNDERLDFDECMSRLVPESFFGIRRHESKPGTT